MTPDDDAPGLGSGLPESRDVRRAVGVLALVAVLVAAVAPAAAAPADTADTTFLVALDESGDAEVALRLAFDVSTEQDRRALERLRANRTAIVAEFRDGVAAVAAGAEAETGREMAVSDASMRVATEGERGVVELTVTWRGLAVVDGDRLRVAAPFDDGFESPGRFVVRAPEGYVVESATPAPTAESGPEATWAAGTSLDGFETTFVPAGTTDEAPSRPMPGFDAPAAVVAVAAVAGVSVLVARRRP